jgi:hypothetical protein
MQRNHGGSVQSFEVKIKYQNKIHNFCSVNPIATNLMSMDSSGHVEHSEIKNCQT